MIRGVHAMFYSTEAEALRAFFRDVLELPATDVGDGWLIFDIPTADMGVHPTDGDPPNGTPHLSFFCDDIHGTVARARDRGAQFVHEVEDHGYGLVTHVLAPGGLQIQLYEAKYRST